ncbi:hypothetical protein IKQ26_02185 [bacterium]|nr:hypothetical protein [bacterium]
MQITLTSKNQEKTFDNVEILNIGTSPNCDFRLTLPFDLLLILQKAPSGKWMIVNSFKNDKVLFRGQPMGASIEFGSLCKLMFAEGTGFITIKISMVSQAASQKLSHISAMKPTAPAPQQPAAAEGGEAPQKPAAPAPAPKTPSSKTISMIQDEELNEFDIKELYGSGINAQTKIKLDKKKADIEKRRTTIIKEVAYKVNYLRQKLAQNEKILFIMNALIFILPFVFMNVLKSGYSLNFGGEEHQTEIFVSVAIAFVVNTLILKQGSYMRLQNKSNPHPSPTAIAVQRLCLLSSSMLFAVVMVVAIAQLLGQEQKTYIFAQIAIFCSFSCILIGSFAGFMKNVITEDAEELDGYEMREDFQAIVKDYQTWIGFFVNNTTKKRIKDIQESLFELRLKAFGEYMLGIATSPFLAYGVSQTLAMCFPDAAGWVRISGLTLSPVFLILATLLIVFAFHCFGMSFTISRRVHASDVIKQDGFSDYNIHGVSLHGSEGTKVLKKEAKKWFFIALAVVAIEITMNVSYFIGEMGDDMKGLLLSFVAALVPTSILIMETTMLGGTKFAITIREEMLSKIDKDF